MADSIARSLRREGMAVDTTVDGAALAEVANATDLSTVVFDTLVVEG